MRVHKAVFVPGLLFALLSLAQELGDQERLNCYRDHMVELTRSPDQVIMNS